VKGKAKILKIFNALKGKQVLGGRVEIGTITLGANLKILRREAEIGRGKIRELQNQKKKIEEAGKDSEFGALVESTIEIAPGDKIEAFEIVEK
jgi:translation initiation factor IF-2